MEPSEHERERIEQLRRVMYSRSLSDKLKDRPRRRLEDVRPVVGEDWTRDDPGMEKVQVAPSYIGTTRRVLWWLLVASIVFFVGAIGFFGYFFTFGGGGLPASPNNIDISVTGPPQVPGGEPAELQISVTNRNRVPLELADLVITYPQGTRSPTDFQTELPSQRISLGTIESGGKRQGTVSAVFAGTEGQKADVQVELEYRVSGSNSIFTADSTYVLTFSSSPLTIAVEGNEQTVSGQPIQMTVTVAANASAPIRDVILSADYPFGFSFASATPAPANGAAKERSAVWKLGNFLPGERKTITLQGSLSGESGDKRLFRFTAGTNVSGGEAAIDTPLAAHSHQVEVAQPFLTLNILVNKEAGTNTAVAPGDNVNVTVQYQNNLSTEITDAIIVARLAGVQIDGATVHTSDGFYRSTDTSVLWDKSTTGGALGRIAPGDKGSVSFTFQVPASEALQSVVNPQITFSVNAAGKRLSEANVPQNLQSAARRTVRLATDLQLAAQGLYYANPFSSTGPMPPKAGTETTYALVFTITNTTNLITGAKMTAHLPPYVRWVGMYSPSTEKLTFNQTDGTVTWNIGDIAPGVGVNGKPARQAAIAIGFTPSTSQIGQAPPLLTDIVLEGYDPAKDTTGTDVTEKIPNVRRTAPNISTNILGDPGFSPADATVVK